MANEHVDAQQGNALRLFRYWTVGEGAAKIRWNTPGDFTRCVRLVHDAADGDMTREQARGYCANAHRAATGVWPGDRRNPG